MDKKCMRSVQSLENMLKLRSVLSLEVSGICLISCSVQEVLVLYRVMA